MTDAPQPTYYASPEEWRAWLSEHHVGAREHWVGFHRRATRRPSLTRDRRLAQLIADSAAGRRIGPLARAS